jgi:hypothetical protein
MTLSVSKAGTAQSIGLLNANNVELTIVHFVSHIAMLKFSGPAYQIPGLMDTNWALTET